MKTTDQDFQIMMTRYFESNDALMRAHFEDDRKAFEEINRSFSKINDRLEKRETLAVQNGEHFSAMGKELSIMNSTLLELKPMLDDYKDNQAAMRTAARWTRPIVSFFKAASIVAVGLAAIWGGFKAAATYLIR